MALKTRTSTNLIVIHCAATPPGMDIGVDTIRKWHRKRGWLDVGYHYVIKLDGTIEDGRPADAMGAHVYGFNSRSIGICMVGGVDADMQPSGDHFTPEQWETLALFVEQLADTEYPGAKVTGHNNLDKNKACPSFDVGEWLESIELGDLKYDG